mgnify:CR=1 FL=1
MHCKMCIKVLIDLCFYIMYTHCYVINSKSEMQIRNCFVCLWGRSLNANEEMFAGNVDADASYPDAT